MKLRDSLKTAVLGLKHAKVRSILTMLGIVIGISSVILLMSIGQSVQDLILSEVQSIGSNLIFVIPGGTHGSRFSSPASVQGIIIKTLIQSDVDALKREPTIKGVAEEVRGQARIIFQNNDTDITYEGVNADFFSVRNFKMQSGAPFSNSDVESLNYVMVLGPKVAETLFGARDPIGKTVRLKNFSFRVVGVLEKKGLGPGGIDQDNIAVIPISIAQKQLLGINYFNIVSIEADAGYNSDFVKARVISVLRGSHHVTDPEKDDFTVQTQQEALDILGTITSVLSLFLTAIASISLIVGGIGIMNIMLVSVVERTKEIGLRKAVGATNRDIMQQFLIEAVMLTFVGGLVGIVFGTMLVIMIYFVLINFSPTGWAFALPFTSIFLAVGVSTLTGLVFGLYPARQAAKKSPIEALRYE
jgi:putative ABC transport system permease protein